MWTACKPSRPPPGKASSYIVKLEEAKKGFVLLPKRWVVERSFAWMARFRRLTRDYERLADTLKGFHWLACSILLLPKVLDGLRLAS